MSSNLLNTLTAEQRAAVIHGEGPLLVVAGAGTGKTKVITHRIAHLIESAQAMPDEILAITFTEKAATEMLDRLVGMGLAALPQHVSTFHAFGGELLSEYSYELGLPPTYELLGEAQQVIFLEDHLDQLPLDKLKPRGRPASHLNDLAKAINRAKAELITVDNYAAWVAKETKRFAGLKDPTTKADAARRLAYQREIAGTYEVYERLKDEHYLIDYGDQILKPALLLRDNADIRARIRDRFRWILIDEYQDTNHAQSELVEQVAGSTGNLTVVGDDDQSIYGFQGARITNILEFERRHHRVNKQGKKAKPVRVVLTQNYRSSQPILDAAYRLVRRNEDRLETQEGFDKRLSAAAVTEQAEPQLLKFPSITDEAEGIAERLRVHHAQDVPWHEMAILMRGRDIAEPLQRALQAAGIPYLADGSGKLYNQPEIKLAARFLLAVADPHDSVAVKYLATSELYSVPQDTVFDAAKRMQRNHQPLWAALGDLAGEGAPGADAIQRLQTDIRQFAAQAADRPVDELLYGWLIGSGFANRLQAAGDPQPIENLGRLFSRLRQFTGAAADATVAGWAHHYSDIVALSDETVAAENDAESDAVRILTAHSAKGLEFEVVCVAGLVNEKFPKNRKADQVSPKPLLDGDDDADQAKQAHRREERRLCYVAMTRAKRFLYLTASTDYLGKKSWRLSDFVREALGESVATTMPERPDDPWAKLQQSAPTESIVSPLPTDEILRLSYTKLKDYWTCPLKYYWNYVAKFPEEPELALEYGQLIHRVLERINRVKLSGKQPVLAESLEWFDRGAAKLPVHSPAHREQVRQEGRGTIKRFFAEEAKRPAPTEVEHEFSLALPGCVVTGKLDRVDTHHGQTTIVDYKTGGSVDSQTKADKRIKESASADQLRIYALAMAEERGAVPDQIVFNFVETGFSSAATPTAAQLATMRERIIATATNIRSGEFAPNRSPHVCSPFADCPGQRPAHRTQQHY